MARKPKPWFWKARKAWYVTISGQRHCLGVDRKQAEKLFHEMMASGRPMPLPAPNTEGILACEVLDKYLAWCEKHRAPKTYTWYQSLLQSFIRSVPSPHTLAASDLKPLHVIEWVDQQSGWSDSSRRGAMVAVQRAFRWATRVGLIEKCPVEHLEKPSPGRRESPVSEEEFSTILAAIHDAAFRDVVEFAWETGARPQEVKDLRGEHVDMAARRVVFAVAESKGKRRNRVVYLTTRAKEILNARQLVAKQHVFLNSRGKPWTANATRARFERLEKAVGRRVAMYDFRHGYCQRLLEKGVDHVTVAALMGHANADMVSRTYSHMNQANDYLLQRLDDATDASE